MPDHPACLSQAPDRASVRSGSATAPSAPAAVRPAAPRAARLPDSPGAVRRAQGAACMQRSRAELVLRVSGVVPVLMLRERTLVVGLRWL